MKYRLTQYWRPMISMALPSLVISCALQTSGPAPQILAADTPFVTPGGAQFKAPGGGWRAVVLSNQVRLESPEGDFRIAIVDVDPTVKDAAVALPRAWRSAGFGRDYPVELASALPPANGWAEIMRYTYDEPPNDKTFQVARLMRVGERWTAALVYGSNAALDKRGSQISIPMQTLLPQGYQRESFAGRTAATLDATKLEALKQFIREAQDLLGVPGVGLSLYQHGKPVFEGGFGVRKFDDPSPVNADTRFMIASNTKALSTLLLAKLEAQGKLAWNDKVIARWPEFQLGSASTTRKLEIQHLVCACTGMPRKDMEWLFQGGTSTPQSEIQRMSTLEPTSGFGELYQYSNNLAAMSGYLGAHILFPGMEPGRAYDRAMQEQVFGPLGMTRTTFDFKTAQRGNVAAPHGRDLDWKVVEVDDVINQTVSSQRPTGGAWSSVRDVMRYLQMELSKGLLPNGTRYIAEASLLKRRMPFVKEGEHSEYAMGLFVDTEWGVEVIHHGGSLVGYQSNMMFLPEHGVAAVVLTNSDTGTWLHYRFMRRLQELLFDGEPLALPQLRADVERLRAKQAELRKKMQLPADPALTARLASRYRNESLGEIRVSMKNGNTYFDVGEWRSKMATSRNVDSSVSFVFAEPWLLDVVEMVEADANGKHALKLLDNQHEYLFVEVGE